MTMAEEINQVLANLRIWAENVRIAAEDIAKLQERLKAGETTGDPLLDHLIMRFGAFAPAQEAAYRDLEAQLAAHVGEFVLVMTPGRSPKFAGACFGSGRMMRAGTPDIRFLKLPLPPAGFFLVLSSVVSADRPPLQPTSYNLQPNPMIITITGTPGSGKTTIAKHLSQVLGVPWYSIGDLRGKMAEERGMTIDELNALGETEAFTDADVDAYQKKLGEGGSACIVDGRLSWHFIPQSFKIFVTVDPAEGGKRIFEARQKRLRPDERTYASPEEATRIAAERIASDERRYKKYYDVGFLDPKNYDLVIDSTGLQPEETFAKVLAGLPPGLRPA